MELSVVVLQRGADAGGDIYCRLLGQAHKEDPYEGIALSLNFRPLSDFIPEDKGRCSREQRRRRRDERQRDGISKSARFTGREDTG
jgi:hypothetical protein